ncbi:hypothetical protein CR983_01310 [Candidatus Saccharibacteria bacterium]|nr:MAG: hypothetical protein CR983_01310 [Candidatus Saccharibacteria bacterium]
MRIGIFDSGLGGRFVAAKLRRLMPEHHYTVIDDLDHAPYGTKTYDEITRLTETAIQPLLDCDVIVIACNTATTAAIETLRLKYPDRVFVGFEPMIRPAADCSTNRHITLLATSATARAPRTKTLIEQYAADIRIDMPDTSGWATAIDAGKADDIDLRDVVQSVAQGSDVIIIGCTHYIALQPRLEQLSRIVLEPTEAVARQINQQAL